MKSDSSVTVHDLILQKHCNTWEGGIVPTDRRRFRYIAQLPSARNNYHMVERQI